MISKKDDPLVNHVNYLGNMVPLKGFRTFVYNINGEKYLAESWEQYEEMISSGEYFSTIDKIPFKDKTKSKKKDE